MALRYFFILKLVMEGKITVNYVKTKHQLADIVTKRPISKGSATSSSLSAKCRAWLSSFAIFARMGESRGFIVFDSAGVVSFLLALRCIVLVEHATDQMNPGFRSY